MIYAFWYNVFTLSQKVEHVCVRLRDLAQRRKMEMIQPVPGFWDQPGSRGW
jgi:hypothetical protein